MFATAAHLVAKTAKQDFTAFMQTEIFDELGMCGTTYQPHLDGPEVQAKLSSSFKTLENGTIIEIPYGFNYSSDVLQFNAGPGGIVTSAADLLKWVEFLIRQASFRLFCGARRANFAFSRRSVAQASPSKMAQLATPACPHPQRSSSSRRRTCLWTATPKTRTSARPPTVSA